MDNITLARRLVSLAAWGALVIVLFVEALHPPLDVATRPNWEDGVGLFLAVATAGVSLAYLSLVLKKIGRWLETAAASIFVASAGLVAFRC
jgi:hypothetical protein